MYAGTFSGAAALFDPASFGRSPGVLQGLFLALVVSVEDPERLARVQVRVFAADGVSDHDAPLWARVAAPFAGDGSGAFFIPNVDDEVVVGFVGGDPRFPIVVGSLWNGRAAPPETLGGARVDRWSFTSTHGARIAIVEESQGQAVVEMSTPGNVHARLKEQSGGSIELEAAGTTITIDTQGVSVQTQAVKIKATSIEVDAPKVTMNSAMVQINGDVTCNKITTSLITSATYSPGAGNVW